MLKYIKNRSTKKYLLSNLVKTQMKKEKKSIKNMIKPLWIPSFFSSFVMILFLSLILFLLKIDLKNLNISIIKQNSIEFQNLLTILNGIGAILIGLAFFVAQSLMDKDDNDRARVLLYTSYFFPLLLFIIGIYLILLLVNPNQIVIFVIIIVGIAIVFSLGSTITILISANKLENKKKKVFFDILRESFINIIKSEIIRRISNNIIMSKEEEYSKKYDGLITLNPYNNSRLKNYIKIYPAKKGSLVDINFKNLEGLINDIIKLPSNNDNLISSYSNELQNNIHYEKRFREPLIMSGLLAFSDISEKTVLLKVRKDLLDNNPYLIKEIKKRIENIFIIRRTNDIEQIARTEISKLKHRCICAIKNDDLDELNISINIYYDLIDNLLDYFNSQLGGSFTIEQAKIENSTFSFERLKPLEWLSNDIREIFYHGVNSKNKEVIIKSIYIPIGLISRSIKKNDFLMFLSYINYPFYILKEAYKFYSKDNNTFSLLFDRSWRYISELSMFCLGIEYKDGNITELDYKNYTFYLIKDIQDMLKLIYDNRDLESFKKILIKTNMFSSNIMDESKNLYFEIKQLENESLFGLSGWILYELEVPKKNVEEYFYGILEFLPTDLIELTNLFINIYEFDKASSWGWDDWELNLYDDFEAHSIDTNGKLEKLYLIKSLIILQEIDNLSIEKIKIPCNSDFSLLINEGSGLFEILDSFKANEEKWENILSTEAINKIVCFKEILLSTKERYEESQLIILRDSRISNKKVREFKEAVLKNIETTPSVKNIFKFYSCVNLLDYDPKIKIKFGINTFFDKHAFLEDGLHQIYLGIEDGFEFGRSIVFGENKDIIDNIDKIVETSDLNTFLTGITDLKIISNYIVLSVNYAIDYIVDKFDNNTYIPNWYEDFNLYKNKFPKEIKGIINIKDGIIPVYEIFDQKSRNELILINIKSLGLINQYHQNKSQEIFNISVEDFFNGSQRESEILSNPPKWLKEVGEPQKQLDHIRERVIIEIYEQFNYTEPNEVDGIRVIISND